LQSVVGSVHIYGIFIVMGDFSGKVREDYEGYEDYILVSTQPN